jgi:21S rRNA (GM2251-2'-O)-methyltransferase
MRPQYLYGLSPVLNALSSTKRLHSRLYISEPLSDKPALISKANSLSLPISQVPKDKIDKFALNKPHQGVVLKTSAIEPSPLSSVSEIPDNSQLWLCLDSITDPQNLGSILRSAYFFQVNGIILPTKNTAPLSATVAKVSCGAIEWLDLFSVEDIPRFLREAKEKGWNVIGAGMGKNRKTVGELEKKDRAIVVLGNEGEGIRDRIQMECQEMVWIKGGDQNVDSLNVGAAAAVLLFELTNKPIKSHK